MVMSACSTTLSWPNMTVPIAALAARTCAAVDSAARTIMSSSFSRPSPPAADIANSLALKPYFRTEEEPRPSPNRQPPSLHLRRTVQYMRKPPGKQTKRLFCHPQEAQLGFGAALATIGTHDRASDPH